MVMGMQPIIRSNNSWTNKQSCQLSCQLCPPSLHRPTLSRTRTHGRTRAASHLPAHPPVGSGKCSASKPPQPRPHESRPPVCFISVKTNRHHTAALSGRDSAGMLGSLLKHASSGTCCAVSRLASSGGQSLQLIIAGAQIGAQRATRAQKERAAITRSSPSVRLSPCCPCRSWRAACPG